MPHYSYEGINPAGKREKGLFEASSREEAKEKLRHQNIILLTLIEKKGKRAKTQLSKDDLLAFTRELSDLLTSSLPLYESLVSLEEKHRGEKRSSFLAQLAEKIKSGASLSKAFACFPESFPPLYLAMVEAGESMGTLPETLSQLSSFLGKSVLLKKQIMTALFYPFLLLGFSLVLLSAFLFFLVPSLQELFADRQLGGITAFVFSLSHLLRTAWPIYLPLASLLVFGGCALWRHPKTKEKIEEALFRWPFTRRLSIEGMLARFSRTLGLLLQGGVSMVMALQLSKKGLSSILIRRALDRTEERVIAGGNLAKELSSSSYFPPLFLRMVAIGEEGGKLPEMLLKAASLYEEEREKRMNRLVTLLPPLCLIFMGVWIALIVMAILLPLTDVSGFMEN